MRRVLRIAIHLRSHWAAAPSKCGNGYLLSEISREDARRWIEEQLQAGRTLPTVGRDSAALSAIYKTAQWEYQQKDPELGSRGNPFSGLRDELKKRDDLAVRKGQRVKSSARAWSPGELGPAKRLTASYERRSKIMCETSHVYGSKTQRRVRLDD